MDIIKVFFRDASYLSFATPSWYHKPKILCAIVYKLQFELNREIIFGCSSKYGCVQWLPEQSKSFPVHGFSYNYYKDDLLFIVPEFNDFASFDDFKPSRSFRFRKMILETYPEYCERTLKLC